MKYLKVFFINIIIFLIIILVSSTLSYFNIINNTTNNILKIMSIIISNFISGIYIGLKSQNKGYIEGIKVGGITILILGILSFLFFNSKLNVLNIIYYLTIFILTIIGSIIGINKRKINK